MVIINCPERRRVQYTVKNVRISTDISWRFFHILTPRGPALRYSVDLRTMQTYTEPVPLKCGKLATKYMWIYEHFYSVVRRIWRYIGAIIWAA